MALPISKQQVYQLPIRNIQPQTGDLFFCCGPYFTSKAVQWLTKSCWSHCGLIWQTRKGTLVLDAMSDMGVRLAPLSKYTSPVQGFLYDGPVVLARWRGLDRGCAEYMIEWALSRISDPYSKLDYLGLWLRGLCGIYGLAYKGERNPASKWLCSELVGTALHVAGFPHRKDGKTFTTPKHLWEHPDLEMLGRIA